MEWRRKMHVLKQVFEQVFKQGLRGLRGWRRWLSLGLLSLFMILATPHWTVAKPVVSSPGSAADLKTPAPAASPSPKPSSAPSPIASPTASPVPSPAPNPTASPSPSPESGRNRRPRPQPMTTRTPAAQPLDAGAAPGLDVRLAEGDRLWLAGQRS
jgi:hypothetical protein